MQNDDKKKKRKIEKNELNIERIKHDRKIIRSNQHFNQRSQANLNHQSKQHFHDQILNNSARHQK